MPQGSGTGPWGYSKYTEPLGLLLCIIRLFYHMFADDTQLHVSVNPNSLPDQLNAKSKIEHCLQDVAQWMTENRLKLNKGKTEFMILGTKTQISKLQFSSLNVCGDEIKTNTCIRNLGVWMDPELKMCHHVKHIQKVCYRNIRELRSIRQYLTSDAIKTLVQAMVISHLDYSNSLL